MNPARSRDERIEVEIAAVEHGVQRPSRDDQFVRAERGPRGGASRAPRAARFRTIGTAREIHDQLARQKVGGVIRLGGVELNDGFRLLERSAQVTRSSIYRSMRVCVGARI